MAFSLDTLRSRLVVSCQAPVDSPLHAPAIIAAIARACANQGAAGVRLDTPEHVRAVRQLLPEIPIIGLWKRTELDSEVYITPRFRDAVAVSEAGAEIIAIDATQRQRPGGETLAQLIWLIHQELGSLVMADVDTVENAIAAQAAGADLIGTTLFGYTRATAKFKPPGFGLLSELVATSDKPIICEGGISTPLEAKKALELGAFCVVVGTAITGIDLKTKAFHSILAIGAQGVTRSLKDRQVLDIRY